MALETGSFIDDLNTSNPAGGDAKSQGDDHLRLIKTCLKGSFPNSDRALRIPVFEEISANETVAAADENRVFLVDTGSGDITVTLPAVSGLVSAYQLTVIKKTSDQNHVIVDGNGSETINGIANFLITNQHQAAVFVSDGSGWRVIAEGAAPALVMHERKTANYTVDMADRGRLIEMDSASATTLSLTAAATLAEGFHFFIHNSGQGILTIDPNSSELINDLATIGVPPGRAGMVVCDGAAWWTVGLSTRIRHERKTGNYTAVMADEGRLIEFDNTSALTLSLTAAATLGDGWNLYVKNSGTGTLTVDPDGAELIDDASTIAMEQDEGMLIICDGTGFWTLRDRAGSAGSAGGHYAHY